MADPLKQGDNKYNKRNKSIMSVIGFISKQTVELAWLVKVGSWFVITAANMIHLESGVLHRIVFGPVDGTKVRPAIREG